MLQKRWVQWLLVLVAVWLVGGLAAVMLHAQQLGTASSVVAWVAATAGALWLYWGLWCWRKRRWVKWTAAGAISANVVVVTAAVLDATGHPAATTAVVGVFVMAVAFAAGLWLIRAVLSTGWAVTGVARTLLDEALRMKIAVIFIVAMVLLVPVLPMMLDAKERLSYRLQFFLTWSLTGVSVLLSLMTIFLACWTITAEVDRRQIFLTMTKPVSRLQYLMGKWLGMALLNLLLVSVAGGGVYVFARMIQQGRARNPDDRLAVQEHVMVARYAVRPDPPPGLVDALYKQRVDQLRAENPESVGPEGTPLSPDVAIEVRSWILLKWHTIAPLNQQTFLFAGLEHAKDYGQTVQLRLKPRMSKRPPDGMVHMIMRVNGRNVYLAPMADDVFHVVDLPVQLIDDEGKLEVRIANINVKDPQQTYPASVSFTPDEGMEVLFVVGGFEANLARSLSILWVRLLFIAILGLMAGTFLSFPVACLLCLLVFFTATASTFMTQSLEYYVAMPGQQAKTLWDQIVAVPAGLVDAMGKGEYWNAVKVLFRLIGSTFVAVVPSFSRFNPVPLLADGRLVPYEMVGGALGWIGVVSSGLCATAAWLIFRRRELARVTV